MNSIVLAAVSLITLTGLDGRQIDINVNRVVSIREPQSDPHARLLHHNVKCVVNTMDGKFISVVESCKTIRRKIEDVQRQ